MQLYLSYKADLDSFIETGEMDHQQVVIAHHLAMLHFTGETATFWSLAERYLMLSKMVFAECHSAPLALAALLQPASSVYLGTVNPALFEMYRALEQLRLKLTQHIERYFIGYAMSDSERQQIHDVELRQLIPYERWRFTGEIPRPASAVFEESQGNATLSTAAAEQRFLAQWNKLIAAIEGSEDNDNCERCRRVECGHPWNRLEE